MFLTIKLDTYTKLNCLKYNDLHKMDLALNNPQRLICHKTQPANQSTKTHHNILFVDHEKKKYILSRLLCLIKT